MTGYLTTGARFSQTFCLIYITPCVPTNVSIHYNLSTARVMWNTARGAASYSVQAVSDRNLTVACNTSNTHCSLTALQCSHTYSITVMTQSLACNNTVSSAPYQPCPPTNVSAEVLCESDEVKISWQEASGAESFLVTVSGSDGFVKTYSTNQALLRASLPCGQDFNVTVRGQGSMCNGIPSSPTFFKTAPCIPRGLATDAECGFDVGSVSWQPTDGAETYIAVATGLDGHTHRCISNTASCTWSDLHCGEEYSVVVRAKSNNCTSLPSNSSIIHMGMILTNENKKFAQVKETLSDHCFFPDPCAPQNLSATVNCDMKVVSLSWDASSGAKMYTVYAEAGNKSVSLNTNMTTASFTGFTLSSNLSLYVFILGPCKPIGVSASQDCLTSIAVVTWQPSNGSDVYTATMQTDTGVSKMCMSDTNQCSFLDLMCGQNFSVSVTASNQQCDVTAGPATSLVPSWPLKFNSIPCPPQNVSTQVDCSSNDLTVSWEAIGDADHFLVSLAAENGESELCNTTNTVCFSSNATCGKTFTVQVTSVREHCRSVHSQTQSIQSEPCPPTDVRVNAACEHHRAVVSWTPSPGAETYHVVAEAADGHTHTCNTSSTNCSLSELHCDEQYTVFVTAGHENCSSKASQNVTLNTGICFRT
uniref:Fibronectin type-III domain-containing protein n=1 Tax=Haplochromis burtoni TaxID=8153 RepID=A0A3Q2W6E4_HAPBU